MDIFHRLTLILRAVFEHPLAQALLDILLAVLILWYLYRWIKPRHEGTHMPIASTAPPKSMRRTRQATDVTADSARLAGKTVPSRVKQPYDALLVLDVEATCLAGTDFDWPNEIIEWPVCVMRWKDRSSNGKASQLEVVDEFRSFVKPTWRPQLSQFCTDLTGITQAQVDSAPSFPDVLKSFSTFLAKNGLIDSQTGRRLVPFCWCSDGPFDIRDFVVKQCFLSKIPMPDWIKGDVMDVRLKVAILMSRQSEGDRLSIVPNLPKLNLPGQLRALGLQPFKGRHHSGIDDARNIGRILTELARRGIRLEANTVIQPGRRWPWMGKQGEVLVEYCRGA